MTTLATSDFILELFTNHSEVFVKTYPIIKPEYFETPYDRVVEYIYDYYGEHASIPTKRLIKAKTGIEIEQIPEETFEPHEVVASIGEIEHFVRVRAMQGAIMKASEQSADVDNHSSIEQMFRDVLTISVDSDLGLSLYDDPKAVIEAMKDDVQLITTGYPSIDKMIGGGHGRGEMLLFMAPSGGGKSVMLANCCAKASALGKDSLYITFEMKDAQVAKRMMSMMTGVDIKEITNQPGTVAAKVSQVKQGAGDIYIKKMPLATNANAIRAYLQEYHLRNKKYPDFIFVDYLDLMRPNDGSKGKNLADIDKEISEELRAVYDETNAYGFSASQLNREALDIVAAGGNLNQGHIAGGLGKARTADSAIAIFRSEEDNDNGTVGFQALKLRNAQPTLDKLCFDWCSSTLKISEGAAPKVGTPKKQEPAPKATASAKDKLNAALKGMKKK